MGSDDLIRLRSRDELALLESLGAVLASGRGLLDAYRAVGEGPRTRARTGRVSRAARGIASRLERGASLGVAVAGTLGSVDAVHQSMLHVIDATGEPGAAVSRACRSLKSRLRLRSRILSASIYPALVTVMTAAGVTILVAFVLPAAGRLLTELGPGTPAAAAGVEAIIERGRTTIAALVALLGAVASLGAVTLVGRRRARRSRWADRLRLRIPIVGRRELETELVAFAAATAELLGVGLPVTEVTGIAGGCVRNAELAARLRDATRRIADGEPVGSTLASVFDRSAEATRWFGLCASGADLDRVAATIATEVERRIERSTRRIESLTEPVLVALCGALVMATLLAVVAPLFALYSGVLP